MSDGQGQPSTAGQQSGCLVDWTWLAGQEIKEATSDLQSLIITFKDGQTLKVRALKYKDDPFLSFDPYYPPKE